MKATDLLKQQHREIDELFREIEMAEDDNERRSLREELANVLAAHTAIEEELFYPAAMEALGPTARIREAFEEHAVADFALYRLVSVSVTDETFSAKLGTLKDVLMNHIEEEESELLPQAEGEMERDQLEQLGERLSARFEERLAEGHRAILERSLGIAARQVAMQAPGAKKASRGRAPAKKATRAPAKRAATKRGAAGQKRGATTAKRGAAGQKRGAAGQKRGAAAGQKRGAAAQKRAGGAAAGGTSRAQTRKAAGQKTAARGQGAAQGTAGRNGQGARGGQKAGARGQAATGARKQRAGR